MKKLNIVIFCMFLSSFLMAQNNYVFKGEIITADGYSPSGNVIALSAKDSSFIVGDFFLDGTFQLGPFKEKELIIQLTSLEFEDTFIPIVFASDSMYDLGIIEIGNGSFDLNEIVVTSRKPVYVQQTDGSMAILIENSTLATSNSVNELLTKAPDVLVNEDGFVSVFGRGAAIFYLNGKRIDQNQLRLIAPSTIKKLLIIRNPSAKYDADGAAVIEIQTIQNQGQGYQIKLKQNVSYSNFAGMDRFSEVNMTFNKGALSSKLNYSLLQGNDRHILHTTRNREAEEVYIQTDLLTEWQHDYENFSNFGLGIQYDFSDKSYLSLEYAGFYEQLGGHQLSSNTIEDRSSTNFYESDIQRNERDINHGMSLNYQKELDTLGSSLFIGGQYSNFNFEANNPIDESSIADDVNSWRSLKNESMLNINILSSQLDYTKIFTNESTLELGAKYSDVENGSVVQFSVADNEGNFIEDQLLSNQFNYKESVAASYINYKGQLSESNLFSVGLRGEYTNYALLLSQMEGLSIDDQYFNLFPQISYTKLLSDNRSINLSFSSRIRRVPYQRLNPVLLYQDPYTSIQGNPASIPERSYIFEVNTKLKGVNVKAGYSFTLDPFGGGAIRGEDDKSYVLIRLNFDESHSFYTSVSKTFETDWISSTNTASVKYTDIIDRVHGFEDVGSKPNLYLYSNNRIPIGDLLNFELSFYYLGDNHEGLYQRKSSWSMSMAIDKYFFDKALKCQLIANDIFHSVRAAGDYSIGPTDIYFHRHWNTNYLRLSLSYDFGKLKTSTYKNREVGKAERNRVR